MMAKHFIYATAGADAPTCVGLPFFIGTDAGEEGHEVQFALAGDATVLVQDSLIENVHLPTLKEFWQSVRVLGNTVLPLGPLL